MPIKSEITLAEEVRTLRKMVQALKTTLEEQLQISLQADKHQPFLGEPVTITAQAFDHFGPRSNVPVTFTTSWGILQVGNGFELQEDSTVTTRTDTNGKAVVTLLPPTVENLRKNQQNALESMLRLLNGEAVTPRDTEAELQELVRQYLWEANHAFRQAVDIYFQKFGSKILKTVNTRDHLNAWTFLNATVFAFTREAGVNQAINSSSQNTTALPLKIRDWLSPWLQTYMALSEAEEALINQLDFITDGSKETNRLLKGLQAIIRNFASRNIGLVGDHFRRKTIEASIANFLGAGLKKLPIETRFAIFPSLETTANTLAAVEPRVFAGLLQTRLEIQQTFDTGIGQLVAENVNVLNSRIDQLTTEIGGKVDNSTFTEFQTNVNGSLRTKINVGTFNSRVGEIQRTIDSLKSGSG